MIGGRMYPGYERYWTAIQNEPNKVAWITGTAPTAAEVAWARFAAGTPHYVLSTTLAAAAWPNTRIVRKRDDIAALKRQSGKNIYLMGGAQTAADFIDAGLVDEIRLIVYPLIAGPGKALFALTGQRRGLELRKVQQLPAGKVALTYQIG
ncbi:dihydrofolate reductase family protein [Bradyrhizobium sp.]|uniref:dihydrofolate reductase family protein n=1 Tax=Bradyrhizobium sp. TaxID=376 RepID=UPI0039E2DDF8